MSTKALASVVALALVGSLSGCTQHDPSPKEIKQPPLKPVPGAPSFTVVKDRTVESRKQTEVQAVVVVPKGTTHTPLGPLMIGLYQQVALRKDGFYYRSKPNVISVKIYDDPEKAKAEGPGALAEVSMPLGRGAPDFVNHLPVELDKQVEKVLGAQPEFGKKLRPKVEVDEATRSVTYQVPYVVPGEDRYVESLAWGDAVMRFSNYAQKLFKGIPTLKNLTFIGILEDKEVVKIRITREQMDQLNLAGAEHRIAHALGEFAAKFATAPNFEPRYKKETEKVRRAELKPLLEKLPPDQVTIAVK